MFAAFSCGDNIEAPSTPLPEGQDISSRAGGLRAVMGDVGGGWNGGRAGVTIGGYFGPNGAVIGGMIGAVAGAVGASYAVLHPPCGCDNDVPLVIDNDGDGVNDGYSYFLEVPSHRFINPSTEIGVLHNILMYKMLNEGVRAEDFIGFYNILKSTIEERQSFGIHKLPENELFLDEIKSIYLDNVYHPNQFQDDYLLELQAKYVNSDSQSFLALLDDDIEKTDDLLKLHTLSILEYSKHFWDFIELR